MGEDAVARPGVHRILVADDDSDIVDLLRMNLAARGYEVTTAGNGEEAWASASESPPDLVVLDVMMPKMDGLEVLAKLRAEPRTRDLPVVMLTARSSDTDVWHGWEAGADYYITKPFDLGELLRFIGYLQVNGRVAT
jgi:DNA-binding response OmpR family regulator